MYRYMFIYSSEQKSSIILWRPGIRQWITRNPGNILYCSQSVPTRATGNTLILPVVTTGFFFKSVMEQIWLTDFVLEMKFLKQIILYISLQAEL